MMTIPSTTFNLLLYSIMFLFGIDFSVSGLLVLKAKGNALKKPKLLGIWIIRTMGVDSKSTNQSKLMMLYMSVKSMAVWSLFGGVLILLGSGIMIVTILLK